jgi:hypothetical protein
MAKRSVRFRRLLAALAGAWLPLAAAGCLSHRGACST